MQGHKRSPEEIQAIVSALEGGETMKQVADRLGVTRQCVFLLLKVRGIENPGRRSRRWTESEFELIESEYKDTADSAEIGRHLGRTSLAVRRMAYILGFRFTAGQKPLSREQLAERHKHVLILLQAGYSTVQIADIRGKSQAGIANLAIRLGANTPRGSAKFGLLISKRRREEFAKRCQGL